MEYKIDATNKKLGRLASEIAVILQGKKSPYYDPRLSGGDTIVVENADKMSFSGNKLEQKVYYRHTGYMGHLKSKALQQVLDQDPAKVLRLAVQRMLPKNFLNPKRMKRLVIKK